MTGMQTARPGAAAIAGALMANESLRELDISENLLKEGGAAAFSEVLHANSTLTKLRLCYNGLRGGVKGISGSLRDNRTLRSLDLRQNDISGVEVLALASTLRSNTSLTVLDLGFEPTPNMAACITATLPAIEGILAKNRASLAAEEAGDGVAEGGEQ